MPSKMKIDFWCELMGSVADLFHGHFHFCDVRLRADTLDEQRAQCRVFRIISLIGFYTR